MPKIIFILLLIITNNIISFLQAAEPHNWLILGAKASHFLTSHGRTERVLKNDTDFLDCTPNTSEDFEKTNPLLPANRVNARSFLIDFKSQEFINFSRLCEQRYKTIMFDWCVLNCALDLKNYHHPQITQTILDSCIMLLDCEGTLFFSDVYDHDKSWLISQLSETGLEVVFLENEHLPDHLKGIKFAELLKHNISGNIIARKKHLTISNPETKQTAFKEINTEYQNLKDFITNLDIQIEQEQDDDKKLCLINEKISLESRKQTLFNILRIFSSKQ